MSFSFRCHTTPSLGASVYSETCGVGLEGISHRKSPNSEPTIRFYVFTLYLELCFLVMTPPSYEPAAIE